MTTVNQNIKIHSVPGTEKFWKFYSLQKGFNGKPDKEQGHLIVFVVKGKLKVTINELDRYVINSKEMFIIQENYSYRIEVLRQAQLMTCLFRAETLLSNQTFINELVPLCNNKKESFSKLPLNKTILAYLSLLQIYIEDNVCSNYFFELKRQELFLLLFVYYSKEELAQFLYFIASVNMQFKELIMNNYRKAKNVRELASIANYSTSGFIKHFQKCFNDSPYDWMQKQKAKQIWIEIKQGVKPLQEIAVENQFSSYQHFSNFCKKQFGLPPTKIVN